MRDEGIRVLASTEVAHAQQRARTEFVRLLAYGGLTVLPDVAGKWWPLTKGDRP